MDISFDPEKRSITLEHRGLDFADAGVVFQGRVVTNADTRREYGEDRFVTAGYLRGGASSLSGHPAAALVASFQ